MPFCACFLERRLKLVLVIYGSVCWFNVVCAPPQNYITQDGLTAIGKLGYTTSFCIWNCLTVSSFLFLFFFLIMVVADQGETGLPSGFGP